MRIVLLWKRGFCRNSSKSNLFAKRPPISSCYSDYDFSELCRLLSKCSAEFIIQISDRRIGYILLHIVTFSGLTKPPSSMPPRVPRAFSCSMCYLVMKRALLMQAICIWDPYYGCTQMNSVWNDHKISNRFIRLSKIEGSNEEVPSLSSRRKLLAVCWRRITPQTPQRD